MTQIWSDTNRYSQTGYSSPTIFPQPENYLDKLAFAEDLALAQARDDSRQEWLWEERAEARLEELERIAEAKAEREEWM